MGKSRLKEVAENIPTIYICVRDINDGYPNASPSALCDYLLNGAHFKQDSPVKVNKNATVGAFIVCLPILRHPGHEHPRAKQPSCER
jgi:hypothetical protein